MERREASHGAQPWNCAVLSSEDLTYSADMEACHEKHRFVCLQDVSSNYQVSISLTHSRKERSLGIPSLQPQAGCCSIFCVTAK